MSIEALLSRGDGSDEPVDLATWTPRKLSEDELLWIDLEAPAPDEIEMVARALRLDDESADAIRHPTSDPTVMVRGDAVEVVVVAPGRGDEQPAGVQILVGTHWVVTGHASPVPYVAKHRERIQDQREIGLLSAVEFLADILDWHVGSFLEAAEELERAIDRLDDAALRSDGDLLTRLVAMRRRVARLRRLLTPQREVFAELSRPEFFPRLNDRESRALEMAMRRLDRADEAISNAREMLIGTFDVHMTRTAQRTNDVMKVLTLASVILLPSVVVAGVMGMNFQVALFDDPNMFWVVLAVMVLLAAATLVVARWRRWL